MTLIRRTGADEWRAAAAEVDKALDALTQANQRLAALRTALEPPTSPPPEDGEAQP